MGRPGPHCHTGSMVAIDLHRAAQGLPAGSGHIMTRDRRSRRLTVDLPSALQSDPWELQ